MNTGLALYLDIDETSCVQLRYFSCSHTVSLHDYQTKIALCEGVFMLVPTGLASPDICYQTWCPNCPLADYAGDGRSFLSIYWNTHFQFGYSQYPKESL